MEIVRRGVALDDQDSRLVSLCNFNETVLDGFNSQVRCRLDFIRVTANSISGRMGKKVSFCGNALYPGKVFEMRFDFVVRSGLKSGFRLIYNMQTSHIQILYRGFRRDCRFGVPPSRMSLCN